MRKFLILTLLIAASNVRSQNPQLLEHTWYLSELILDDVSYLPPSDITAPSTILTFSEDSESVNFTGTVCNSVTAFSLVFDNVSNTFAYSQCAVTLGVCAFPANNNFDMLYTNFYYTQSPVLKTMNYEITETNSTFSLVVTSESNDKAIYSSQSLGTQSIGEYAFYCYPNPTSAAVNIEGSYSGRSDLNIFNSLGQLVRSENFVSLPTSLNISNLNAGIYFILINSGDKRKIIKITKI